MSQFLGTGILLKACDVPSIILATGQGEGEKWYSNKPIIIAYAYPNWCGRAEGEAVLPRKGRKTLVEKVACELHLEEYRGVSQAEEKRKGI